MSARNIAVVQNAIWTMTTEIWFKVSECRKIIALHVVAVAVAVFVIATAVSQSAVAFSAVFNFTFRLFPAVVLMFLFSSHKPLSLQTEIAFGLSFVACMCRPLLLLSALLLLLINNFCTFSKNNSVCLCLKMQPWLCSNGERSNSSSSSTRRCILIADIFSCTTDCRVMPSDCDSTHR